MAPSSPVRIVDAEGRVISATNPLPTSGSGGGGGGGDVTVVAPLPAGGNTIGNVGIVGEMAGEFTVVPDDSGYLTAKDDETATGVHEMVAAPTAGNTTYVRIIQLQTADLAYVSGEIRWGATKEFPFTIGPEGNASVVMQSDNELKGTAALNLYLSQDANVSWWVQYRVAPTPS